MKKSIIIILLSLISVTKVNACTCDSLTDSRQSVEKELSRVEVVLELNIIEVLEEPSEEEFFGIRILRAEVLQSHKGKLKSDTIKIYTEVDGGASCHFYFDLGKSYLFYGEQGNDGYFHTTVCRRTKELSNSFFDLKILRNR